jgi:hypothetical protein
VTIKELCIEMGIQLSIRVTFQRSPQDARMGSHVCTLKGTRYSIDGERVKFKPQGIGWSEKEAIANLVEVLGEMIQRHEAARTHTVTLKVRSVYDRQIQERELPRDLTA